MRSIRTRTALAVSVLALAAGVPAAGVHASTGAAGAQAVVAKHCGAGYVKAKMPNGTKCLRAGQFCSRKRKFQRRYHHYGFHCKRNRHLRRY